MGRDPVTDVAVLRLQGAQPLKAIQMGDSGRLDVGDFVIAVGNPFGLGQTVTPFDRASLSLSGAELPPPTVAKVRWLSR